MIEISEEAVVLADGMLEILALATTAVMRQQAIEVMMAGHALRMKGPREHAMTIDGMAKHAKQIVTLLRERGNVG